MSETFPSMHNEQHVVEWGGQRGNTHVWNHSIGKPGGFAMTSYRGVRDYAPHELQANGMPNSLSHDTAGALQHWHENDNSDATFLREH